MLMLLQLLCRACSGSGGGGRDVVRCVTSCVHTCRALLRLLLLWMLLLLLCLLLQWLQRLLLCRALLLLLLWLVRVRLRLLRLLRLRLRLLHLLAAPEGSCTRPRARPTKATSSLHMHAGRRCVAACHAPGLLLRRTRHTTTPDATSWQERSLALALLLLIASGHLPLTLAALLLLLWRDLVPLAPWTCQLRGT